MKHLNLAVRRYRENRKALTNLRANQEVLIRYQELLDEDLATVTAVMNPNSRGQSRTNLAWFWKLDVTGMGPSDEYMAECEFKMSLSI